ncbi:MAG TPA: Imm27 family immunity protein [Gemmatimonadaceae bacterium]
MTLEGRTDPQDRDVLRPGETDLVGQWLDTGSRIEGDGVCARIERLTTGHLVRVAASADGRRALYRDPLDGRLWELTYPHASMPRGGPPRLTVAPPERAKSEYGVDHDPRDRDE